MREDSGWELPPSTTATLPPSTRPVREGGGSSIARSLGKADVTGRDRAAFLQGMLTNDVKALAPGAGVRRRVPRRPRQGHGPARRLRARGPRCSSSSPRGSTEKTLQLFDKYLISEKAYFEPADDAFAIVPIQGPVRARGCSAARRPRDRARAHAARRGHDRRRARARGRPRGGQRLRYSLLDRAGARRRGVGGAARRRARARWAAEALNVLRVEAGVPWYGRDVDESVDPAGDAARGAGALHQGLLHRPGGRGPREVPRPRQPRRSSGLLRRRRPRAGAAAPACAPAARTSAGSPPRFGSLALGSADRARLRAPGALGPGHRGRGRRRAGHRRRPGRGAALRASADAGRRPGAGADLRREDLSSERDAAAPPHQPPRPRDEPVPPPARAQPGRLVPVGPRGARRGRGPRTSRSCCRSATRPATGAT